MDILGGYEVVVIGAGHAGIEAACAAAKLGAKTALFTLTLDGIGNLPCNPSIGGTAKGHLVREIDALGGVMGIAADATFLQSRMLNMGKGPAVHSLRVQTDRRKYHAYMKQLLEKTQNLEVKQAEITAVDIRDGAVCGVCTHLGGYYRADAVIVATGTYLGGRIFVGEASYASGPDGQHAACALTESLRAAGVPLRRFKTGTPARVNTASIDFSGLEVQPGTKDFVCFSEDTEEILPFEQQMVCYLTYTSPQTHAIIQEHLQESAMYSGLVKGVGPRYCPSIEDKLVRFADKPRHQIFLEPESRSLDTTYVQGFSTSMPHDVQEKMLHSLPGLEHCEIDKFGYAIEYDAIDPLQCRPTLENKVIAHLFTAGQINGTSGYEEAAAQGLIAGINAVAALDGTDGLILGRDEAYIGVMIDDLVTKGTNEPYRLLTSRAEYRLLLRHDNADVRLTGYGHERGLISEERYQRFLQKQQAIETGMQMVKDVRFTPKSAVNEYLQALGYEPLKEGISAFELLRRPKVTIAGLQPYADLSIDAKAARQIEIEIKYEGYIAKARRDARHLRAMDQMRIPKGMDYATIEHLSLEARQKLAQIQPMTLGQASRISGVNPADLAVLAMVIKQR